MIVVPVPVVVEAVPEAVLAVVREAVLAVVREVPVPQVVMVARSGPLASRTPCGQPGMQMLPSGGCICRDEREATAGERPS